MPHSHCQLCGAHFDRETELEQHKASCHHEQERSAAPGSAEKDQKAAPRKDHEFTRSHHE
jgi:hypothetical protein